MAQIYITKELRGGVLCDKDVYFTMIVVVKESTLDDWDEIT